MSERFAKRQRGIKSVARHPPFDRELAEGENQRDICLYEERERERDEKEEIRINNG